MFKKQFNGIVEIQVKTCQEVKNPFWDIEVNAVFTNNIQKIEQKLYGFYDGKDENGEHVWKIRWVPNFPGEWTCNISSYPFTQELMKEFTIQVDAEEINKKGFLRAYPKEKWGLWFDNREPFFLLGDTMYNLFGAHYCGVDVESVLRHRKAQGVNYVRARMQVSPFHPHTGNTWQTKACWPWGGSAQMPDFTRFNLDYFHAVDEVISVMTDLGMGLELIFEAWLGEFPFNDRNKFLSEYEELWFKYIISRYTAYPAVYVWCPANEYEFYPIGEVKYHSEADRWLKRLASTIRQYDPYHHPIGAHNWEQKVPLAERLDHVDEIDIYLVQTDWLSELMKFDRDASLCMWLKDQMNHHSAKKEKVAICAEFGYEAAGNLYTVDVHERFDHNHTRRGQWRAGFSGYPVVHGFNNTWGSYMTIEPDAVGAASMIHYYRFMTEEIKFYEMAPKDLFLFASGSEEEGTLPICLANDDRSVVSVYFPTKGQCELELSSDHEYAASWMNPRTGEKSETFSLRTQRISTPESNEGNESWGDDWVLLLKK